MTAGEPVHVVAMGVSATGKSTVAEALAQRLDLEFIEGDDYHSPASLEKMSAGVPLTDADRLPWLRLLATMVAERSSRGTSTVLTCSALRRTYRDVLRSDVDEMYFVHLHADFDVLLDRMGERTRHFMPSSLLQSQFDTLEPLEPDEAGTVVDVAPALDEVVDAAETAIREALSLV